MSKLEIFPILYSCNSFLLFLLQLALFCINLMSWTPSVKTAVKAKLFDVIICLEPHIPLQGYS